MKSRPRDDPRDPFDREAPPLSLVDLPAGHDPLGEFAAEPAASQPIHVSELREPLEALELVDQGEGPRTYPTPRGYRTLRAYRTPRPRRPARVRRAPRTLFALAALAAVAVISITTLNSLTGRVAPDAPAPTDVVAAVPPVQPPARRANEPPAPAPAISPREIARADSPRTDSPRADTQTAQSPTPPTPRAQTPPAPAPRVETAGAQRRVQQQPASVARNTPAPSARPARVSEPLRPIAAPSRQGPPVQAAVPPAATRRVDTAPEPAPPAATATTGVRPTNSVPGPRLDLPSTPTANAVPATATTTPPAPPPIAPANPPPAALPAAASAARVVAPAAAIQSVLGRYASAFSALDARGAKAVWPGVNERNLARAFESLEQQEFDLGDCEITVTAPRAVAACRGTARYTPRMGNKRMRTESRQWTFTLEANGETWSIASVDSR